jgi:hypothetical protein
MTKNIQPGFFTMEDATIVLAAPNIFEAKRHAHQRIIDYVQVHPDTHKSNITKAENMVNRSSTMRQLAMAISDFVLAHTSENLKVIK